MPHTTYRYHIPHTNTWQDCPLGVRHVFCLFDGHGGDSVAEYCRMHLTGRLLRCLREAQAKVTATTTSEGTTSEGTSSIAPPPSEGNPSKRPTKGEGRGSGGGGGGTPSKGRETPSERRGGGSKERGVTSKGGTPGGPKGRGGGTPGGGGGGGGRSTQGGVGVGVGASAEASSMIAECVRGACREVDAKVGHVLLSMCSLGRGTTIPPAVYGTEMPRGGLFWTYPLLPSPGRMHEFRWM